ncbi:MAG: hypothetical protein ACKO3T_16810, partial [Planctomycetaceae bacterium]|jgi:hypothetical protein
MFAPLHLQVRQVSALGPYSIRSLGSTTGSLNQPGGHRQDSFKYEYRFTEYENDYFGERWRVAVPLQNFPHHSSTNHSGAMLRDLLPCCA